MSDALVRLFGWPAVILQRDPTMLDRYRWLRRRLPPGPGRLLDAGCGSGEFVLYAARRGYAAVGVSYDERLNAIGRRRAALLHLAGAHFITADLRRLDEWAGDIGAFDVILCLETLEHIANDQRLLAGLARLLRPGGRLLLTAPHAAHRRAPGEAISLREDGGHVRWGYTPAGLRQMCEGAGLRVLTEETITGVVTQQIVALLARLGNGRAARALTFPLRALQIADGALTHVLRYPFYSVAIVAMQPAD